MSNDTHLHFARRSQFRSALRERVDAHFGDRPRRGDPRLIRKACLITVWLAASYVVAMAASSAALLVLSCVSCALAAAALGFNVFHDANHGAFSARNKVNAVLATLTCALLGPSRYLWHYKHHVYHHVYTNIYGWDDDIETRGHLRMSSRQPWHAKYRHQHLAFVLLYGLSTIEWFFVKDFVQYFSGRMTHRAIPPLTAAQHAEFWLSKLSYVLLFVALPFAFHPVATVLAGLLLFHLTLGLALTFVFQLAHGTEDVEFPEPSGSDPALIDDEWAAHVMRTTVNFATGNRAMNWYVGGLNFQIEHHLFPLVSHVHYPELAPIVRRTAREFGLPSRDYLSYSGAIFSHYRLLRALGTSP
jgi:linoleoyl-CoA desaturase